MQEHWLKYLIEQWNPWAERHRRWKSVQRIYGELFSMYSRQKKLAEDYELLLGLGLLTWVTPSNQRVRRHLLVAQANLLFDANRGVLSVRAAAEGAKLSIETDMLEPDERPILEQQKAVEQIVRQAIENPPVRLPLEAVRCKLPVIHKLKGKFWIRCLLNNLTRE